ncbi:MAG: phosphoribosylamine--glycine ligase [bacterium]
MRVLLYGGGAREHALAWKIKQSPMLNKLFLYDCNDGFKKLGTVLTAENIDDLVKKVLENDINMVIIGPEAPLVGGFVDKFEEVGINCIGANKKWANLEGSKSFAKDFMVRNNIPTARYKLITDISQADDVLQEFNAPYVIKADGLASGKGVYIANSQEEAWMILSEYLSGMFGESSKKIVIEEFLEGDEVSLISLWDGRTLLPLIPARDYKRLFDNNSGPNTGGMGAYCPVNMSKQHQQSLKEYSNTLSKALRAENADFHGIVYSGIMLTDQGVRVLEYNMRFGDPETQAIMMHMNFDLLELFSLCVNKRLDEAILNWNDGISFCLVIAAEGYPIKHKKGSLIKNAEELKTKYNVEVFYAGVKEQEGNLVSNGGRVLSICASGKSPAGEVYTAAELLEYEDKYYRSDIGE